MNGSTATTSSAPKTNRWLAPSLVSLFGLGFWWALAKMEAFPPSVFPSPQAVGLGFWEELRTGRLSDDVTASVFRVTVGFLLATLLGVPLGLWLGMSVRGRIALMPSVNFFRNLSPLAWIPFAVLWFGVGDGPAIFLIFMSTFFTIVLATASAVAAIPAVYYRVAGDFGIRGARMLKEVTLPAIMPQLITTLRVTCGLAWVVVVAAEMVAGHDGLGFAIWDARNGLRTDILVSTMVMLGMIGVVNDRLLVQLTRIPSVRWGYEQ